MLVLPEVWLCHNHSQQVTLVNVLVLIQQVNNICCKHVDKMFCKVRFKVAEFMHFVHYANLVFIMSGIQVLPTDFFSQVKAELYKKTGESG